MKSTSSKRVAFLAGAAGLILIMTFILSSMQSCSVSDVMLAALIVGSALMGLSIWFLMAKKSIIYAVTASVGVGVLAFYISFAANPQNCFTF